jgi:hypothetical protein
MIESASTTPSSSPSANRVYFAVSTRIAPGVAVVTTSRVDGTYFTNVNRVTFECSGDGEGYLRLSGCSPLEEAVTPTVVAAAEAHRLLAAALGVELLAADVQAELLTPKKPF